MRFTQLVLPALLGLPIIAATPLNAVEELKGLEELNKQALEALDSTAFEKRAATCNIFNAHVRRDWRDFSKSEKRGYIRAVKCLMARPSIADPGFAPGARSRYDDFVAGNFLTWHRYFLWAYEQALKKECAYSGYQPYWNWLDHKDDLENSPLFDGSETSFSGDGSFVQHNGSVTGGGNVWIASGNGGGCVTSGPFVDYEINLGPVLPTQDGLRPAPTPLGYNPHCLIRDLSTYSAVHWLTLGNILNITTGAAAESVLKFQNELQGRFTDGFLGLHSAGHGVMGGVASDLFASPVDPVFWLHHAMVDRVYWIWQALHPSLANTIAGTLTILNTPPSRDTSVEDMIDLGVNSAPVAIKNVLDTIGGDPMCYIYI